MGLLDRFRSTPDETREPAAGEEAIAPVDEVTTRRPSAEDEERLAAARSHYDELGIQPQDLSSIAAAYEAALDAAETSSEASATLVEVVGTAIGDHLVGRGYRWVVSTDPFGSDLAVEPARRGMPVVVHTVVAVRWMARERGWVEKVTERFARVGGR
jgi:hypothetical protein